MKQGPYQNSDQIFWLCCWLFFGFSDEAISKYWYKQCHQVDREEKLFYSLIYALSLVELEILKTYIKIYLKTGFIQPFKSPANVPIHVDKKLDGSLHLYINYRGLNNLTIKNWYPLPQIREALNCLRRAKRFTQLDLTSIYHWMRIREGDK